MDERSLEIIRKGVVGLCRCEEDMPVLAPCGFKVERHAFSESFVQLEGGGPYYLGGRTYDLRPGMLCVIEPWISHENGMRAGTRMSQLWFRMTDGAMHFWLCSGTGDGGYTLPWHGKLSGEYGKVFQEVSSHHGELEDMKLRRFVDFMLACLLEELGTVCHGGGVGNREASLVTAVKSHIVNRNGVDCSLSALSEIFGYSRSHLCHVFRHEAGISIGDYIDQVRREFSVQASSRGMSQKEIALELGFSSASAYWLWKARLDRRSGGDSV